MQLQLEMRLFSGQCVCVAASWTPARPLALEEERVEVHPRVSTA